ncbi:hypothetical protein H0A36_29840, partial [Endozoicomonas sp. SM1973]
MNQVGFAQLMEMGPALSHVGWLQFMKHVPELRKMIKRMENGNYKDNLLEELSDAMGGWANGRLMHQVTNQIDDFGATFNGHTNKWDKLERGLDHMGKFTANMSGFHSINHMLQNLTMKGMAQNFLDYSLKNKRVMSTDRLRELGIDDELLSKIKHEYRHVESKNGKLTRMNFDKWDPDVHAKFSYAIGLWGRRIIQEQDFGDGVSYLMSKELGKTLIQFRTFAITAYSKQLL